MYNPHSTHLYLYRVFREQCVCFVQFLLQLLLAKEAHEQINRQREDIGVVVLCRNGVQCLQVAQL